MYVNCVKKVFFFEKLIKEYDKSRDVRFKDLDKRIKGLKV